MWKDITYTVVLPSSNCCMYQYRYHGIFRQICQHLFRYQFITMVGSLGSWIKVRQISNYCGRSGPLLLMVGNTFFFSNWWLCFLLYALWPAVQLGLSRHFVQAAINKLWRDWLLQLKWWTDVVTQKRLGSGDLTVTPWKMRLVLNLWNIPVLQHRL